MPRNLWDDVAPGWETWWPVIEHGGQKVSDRLVELAGLQPGQKALDLATGGGEPALTAARAVGESGFVLGLDISPGMLDFARRRAESAGLRNVLFRDCDGHRLPDVGAAFDAALCRWGLMFAADLVHSLSQVRSALKMSGRFAFSVWDAPDKRWISALGIDAIEKLCGPMERPPDFPDPSRLADTGMVRSALEKAGFTRIFHEKMTVEYHWKSAEDFTSYREGVSPQLRHFLSTKTPELRKAALDALTEAARKNTGPDGSLFLQSETINYLGFVQ